MNLLICDPIDESVITYLQQNGFNINYEPDITAEALPNKIATIEGVVVRSRTKITSEIIAAAKNLKIIARVGSGIDNIDVVSAQKNGIKVINAPGANAQAVAELTVGLILSLLRFIPQADTSIKNGQWLKKTLKGGELSGKIVGIIGLGNVGKRVGQLVEAFGASLITHDRADAEDNLNNLLKKADIVTIHAILSKATEGLLNKARLSLMKEGSFLVNTARAEIIDEDALFEAVTEKKIAGVALDVHWEEPLKSENKWTKLSNVILTPHLGGQTFEASKKAAFLIAESLVKFKSNEL